MDNGNVTWTLVIQVVGGVMLTAACGGVGYLTRGFIDLKSDLAALTSRVETEHDATLQSFADIKTSLGAMNEKLDRLIERKN